MNKENKNYSYQYPENDKEILAKIMDPNYEGGNIGLSENASDEEIEKYRIGKEILAFQYNFKLTTRKVAQKLSITEKEIYDICRGKVDVFSYDDLLNYRTNLFSDYLCGLRKGNEGTFIHLVPRHIKEVKKSAVC